MKTLIFTAFLTACSYARGGAIAEAYSKTAHPDVELTNRAPAAITLTNHGITEIGIERTECYGTCPVYTFVLKSDGTFRYKGEKFIERQGEFTGTVSVHEFNRLAQYIKDSGYLDLRDGYGELGDDGETVYTTLVLKGRRKVVMDHSYAGPPKLWAIENLIDHILVNATWKTR
jgi:hypothetical protein